LRLNNILLCVYTTFYLSTHLPTNTWFVYIFWLLRIILLRAWVYTKLFEFLLSVLLYVCVLPEMELRGQIVIVFLICWGFSTVYHSDCTILHC
jgi:hypothetical protein